MTTDYKVRGVGAIVTDKITNDDIVNELREIGFEPREIEEELWDFDEEDLTTDGKYAVLWIDDDSEYPLQVYDVYEILK